MEDTICAIATTPGVGAISIIRVSGINAVKIVNSIFKEKNLQEMNSHTIHYGHIIDDAENIDEVLVMLMKAPKTFTAEDTVEINCHGGINTTKKVLELLLKKGCRLAEPGEFTKRAFLNGRINLLEAESVNDLILSETDASRKMALNNVDGLLTKKIENLREQMVRLLANIEVNIDYPEYEDEVQVTHDLLENKLKTISEELEKIVKDSQNGRIIRDGINIAIIGKPNVGKSSILNTLLDEEKAIVTNIPGTTRDIVEGIITLNGIKINLIDTAGIRETEDLVEQIGVSKSLDIAKKADMILFVLNNNEELTEEEQNLLESLDVKNVIIFINKSDLETKLNFTNDKYQVVYGNTKDLDGLALLKGAIIDKFCLNDIVFTNMSYLSNIRQIDLINKANKALKSAFKAYKNDYPVDIIEIDIKEAWKHLGEIIGETYSDELVDNIFKNFCLGK